MHGQSRSTSPHGTVLCAGCHSVIQACAGFDCQEQACAEKKLAQKEPRKPSDCHPQCSCQGHQVTKQNNTLLGDQLLTGQSVLHTRRGGAKTVLTTAAPILHTPSRANTLDNVCKKRKPHTAASPELTVFLHPTSLAVHKLYCVDQQTHPKTVHYVCFARLSVVQHDNALHIILRPVLLKPPIPASTAVTPYHPLLPHS